MAGFVSINLQPTVPERSSVFSPSRLCPIRTSGLQKCGTISTSHSCFSSTRSRFFARRAFLPVRQVLQDEKVEIIVAELVDLRRPVKDVSEFDDKLANNELALAFVGMSNTGKSHRSAQLVAQRKFEVICVDDLIEEVITPELEALGYSGIEGMAQWMGYPSDSYFKEREARYLELEDEITRRSKQPEPATNFCLDTTGSVIYLPQNTLGLLRHRFLIVHLEATDAMLESMIEKYFECPKPVAWGDVFNMADGESSEDALRRCYPDLLRWRRQRYQQLAHVNVSAAVSQAPNVPLEGFLDAIRDGLSS